MNGMAPTVQAFICLQMVFIPTKSQLFHTPCEVRNNLLAATSAFTKTMHFGLKYRIHHQNQTILTTHKQTHQFSCIIYLEKSLKGLRKPTRFKANQ